MNYHSALHDSDNVEHTDPTCPSATSIIRRCYCLERRPASSRLMKIASLGNRERIGVVIEAPLNADSE